MEHDVLMHYGTPRHSGRYPWGSGENPYQHEKGFKGYVADLKKQGVSEKDIARGLGMTTTEMRQRISLEKEEEMASNISRAIQLKEHGYSNSEIARKMGVNESNVRSYLKQSESGRVNRIKSTADMLKQKVDEKGFIDVGLGVESQLGISRTQLKTAVARLKAQGYEMINVQVDQLGTAPGNKTTISVLAPPGTTYKDVVTNKSKINQIQEYSLDNGKSWLGIKDPTRIDPKRIKVNYSEDGGNTMDGTILLRRGVEDLNLGSSHYAQVRIAVEGERYLKGMAIYAADQSIFPKGVDIIYNQSKHKKDYNNDLEVMKPMDTKSANPFGATVRQKEYLSKDGTKKLSALNIVNEESDWDKWSRTISSQMLSKQRPELARQQLDLAYNLKLDEFNEIKRLNHPTVKKLLLSKFADECDSASVHLKAAALPRQQSHVILPLNTLKENEVYAPNYKNGERLALIRYPHGGIFEIPEVVVNNKNKEAISVMGNAKDGIGINHKVAERLSGADFDGDTVIVIPNNDGKVKTSEPLQGLKDFNPSERYPAYEGMPKVGPSTGFHKQNEMGRVSNLITDMTLKGADREEIARAVRHSMVVIDAEKHNLNWRQSEKDNNIAELKKIYQGGERAGASTLISKASSEDRTIPDRKEITSTKYMNDEQLQRWKAGEKVYVETGATYKKRIVDKKTGEVIYKEVLRKTSSPKMAEVRDARELSSGTRMEEIYASYVNDLKALSKEARALERKTGSQVYSPTARRAYAEQVKTLDSKVRVSFANKPKERAAQLAANTVVDAEMKANPGMEKDEIKRLKNQALAEARSRFGASGSESKIDITPTEWKAIDAGAISENKLKDILNSTDLDVIKSYATPRTPKGMTTGKIARAKAMLAQGYTQAEVADALGVSVTTINRAINS